ncbi:MAG: MarR family transcriptional regulator [Candidatus Thorarchaeota archaeon]
MSGGRPQRIGRDDVLLVLLSLVMMFAALWMWFMSRSIGLEVVLLATTAALVISLLAVLATLALLILRLQEKIVDLELRVMNSLEPSKDSATEQVILVALNNVERRILNCLEEHGARMTQDDIRRAVGVSKSTLSTALSSLERKQIIEREIDGRKKTVILRRSVVR